MAMEVGSVEGADGDVAVIDTLAVAGLVGGSVVGASPGAGFGCFAVFGRIDGC